MLVTCDAAKDYAEMKVVERRQLQEATRDGWRFVAAIIEDTTSFDDDHGRSRHAIRDGELQVFKATRYLVGRDRDTTVASLCEERDEAMRKYNALGEDVYQQKQAANKAAEELAASQKAHAASLVISEARQDSYLKAIALAHKMETDLAKVRRAIGDLKFKEIVS